MPLQFSRSREAKSRVCRPGAQGTSLAPRKPLLEANGFLSRCYKRLPFAVALATLAVGATPARAQGRPTLAFRWTAPSGCPSEQDVRSEVARLLGRDPANPAAGNLAVNAQVTHDESWRVTLGMTSPSEVHTRTVQAQTCRGLADATALILALMI